MGQEPLVSIIIPTIGRTASLERCLESVRRNTTVPYEIVLVIPKSVALPVKLLEECTLVYEEEPTGCVRAYNKGLRVARGKYLAHLNDDCEPCPSWIDNMLALIGNRKVLGAFYFKEPDDKDFHTNSLWGKLYANFTFASRELFEEMNFFDDVNFKHFGFDPDFSLSVWHAGYEVVATPDARVIHYRVEDEHRQEHLREIASTNLYKKWKGIFC